MMLSRIAMSVFSMGRSVERARNIAQIIEVNHKMNLERATCDDVRVWRVIADAFDARLSSPDERSIYETLVFSDHHPYSVRHRVNRARFEGRAIREHISEEMWLHLNHTHLEFQTLDFDTILRIGRSEFNRRVTIFADGFCGLADDTMIRGEAWAFLKLGKLCERADMICRVLQIKQALIAPGRRGIPIDVHQWQALLRSLSGYEPYRRAYDARIVPSRVLDFVLKEESFPRSLSGCFIEMQAVIGLVSKKCEVAPELGRQVNRLIDEIRLYDPEALLDSASFSSFLDEILDQCEQITRKIDRIFISSPPEARSPGPDPEGVAMVIPQ